MLDLTAIKGKDKSFSEFLNWGSLIDNGILLNKDGSLMAGHYFRGRDIHSSSLSERAWIAERFDTALASRQGGWTIWIEANKDETYTYPRPEESHFPDPISRMIDDERRQQFAAEGSHYETEYAIIQTFTPPLRSRGRIIDLIYDDDTDTPNSPASIILDKFKRDMEQFEDALSGAALLRRMETEAYTDDFGCVRYTDNLVDYLNHALTGNSANLHLDPGTPVDAVLGAGEVSLGETIKVGNKFNAVVHIRGFAKPSHPNVLDVIDCLPMTMRWSTRYIPMDQHEWEKQIKRVERKWKQKSRGFLAQVFKMQGGVNQDAEDAYQEAVEARQRSAGGRVGTGYYTSVVVLSHESRAQVIENARELIREIGKCGGGFQAVMETTNAPESFLGSLPAHSHYNVRRPIMHTDNLADLLPVAGIWTGSRTNPCPPPFFPPNSPALMHCATTGATPFRLNLYHGDVGHCFIFGPTGKGKTTLLNTVSAQALRYAGMRIWAFDYKKGMLATLKAVGGKHFDIVGEASREGNKERGLFCPLSVLKTPSDIVWGGEWVADCCEMQTGSRPDNKQKDKIHTALLAMIDSPYRSLTHFQGLVQDQEVRDAIQPYTLSGPYGFLLDAEADGIEYGRLMGFEMESLMALKEAAAIPVLLYLFRRFDMSLNGQPTMLLLDEAWIMLGHPVFKAKLQEWLRVLRSKNCSVVMATQQLGDAVRSGIMDVITNSCLTKIALANEEADNPGTVDVYRMFGLQDAQIDLIKHATPKRDYYVFSPAGRRLISLNLGPIALAFTGCTSLENDVPRVLAMEKAYGEEWPIHWLRELGVVNAKLKLAA
jgi:type IV secretion system protein VirB4